MRQSFETSGFLNARPEKNLKIFKIFSLSLKKWFIVNSKAYSSIKEYDILRTKQ